ITTRTVPPTRRSTSAWVVSQSRPAWNQRRRTSSLVHASNTAWAGARYVRSIRSVRLSVMGGTVRRTRSAGPASGGVAVRVVVVPPLVGRRLRVAVGRVLPRLLAAERGQVEVAPRAAHGLVSAAVDEVR